MPATHDDVLAIRSARVSQGCTRIAALAPTIGPEHISLLLTWADDAAWRSSSARSYWIDLYFLLARHGDEAVATHLDEEPDIEHVAEMHYWLREVRAVVADAIRAKQLDRRVDVPLDGKLPRKKADLHAYILERLGDPRWNQVDALVTRALKTKQLRTAEGLGLCLALLVHGNAASLAPLADRAATEGLLKQILDTHGVDVRDLESERAGFLAAIATDPHSDDPRRVYADWLAEQGDPRGAMINTQLAGGDVPLKRTQRIQLAGEVGGLLRTKAVWNCYDVQQTRHQPIYRRGFLAGACIETLDGTASGAHAWSTLQVMDVLKEMPKLSVYTLPSLTGLGGLHSRDLDRLLAHPVADQLEALGIRRVLKADLKTLWERVARLPKLRILCFEQWWDLEGLLGNSLLERIEWVLPPAHGRQDSELEAVAARVPNVRRWPHFDGILLPAFDLVTEGTPLEPFDPGR